MKHFDPEQLSPPGAETKTGGNNVLLFKPFEKIVHFFVFYIITFLPQGYIKGLMIYDVILFWPLLDQVPAMSCIHHIRDLKES